MTDKKALYCAMLFAWLALSAVSCTLAFNYWVALPEKPRATHSVRYEQIVNVNKIEKELTAIHTQLNNNQIPSSTTLTSIANELTVYAKSKNTLALINACHDTAKALNAKDLVRAQQSVINAEHACRAVQDELALMRQTNGH